MNLRYLFVAIISIPLLPLMYLQGKRIKSSIPKLPEATGNEGSARLGDQSGKGLKMIAIGESTIAGVGVATHQEGFTGTFATELSSALNLDVAWKVYARSGYTARSVEKKIVPMIAEKQVNLVLIGLGGNDAFTLNRPAKWKMEVRSLIETINLKYPDAVIVFCNMPPIKEFPAFTALIKFTVGNLVEILGEALRAVVADYDNVYFVSETITLESWVAKSSLSVEKEAFFSDGVHPSKLTYQTWAREVAEVVSSNESIKTTLQSNAHD